jgi:hypothetical protein
MYEKALRNGREAEIVYYKDGDCQPPDDEDVVVLPNFSTDQQLGKYSWENSLIYPKRLAKDEGALRFMLRHILSAEKVGPRGNKFGYPFL